ncbi:ABC transporter permease [Nocardioides sp. SYSU D00038]|uniref:ABC transporter permease n=1 Tax=Nocardioides sp. SYSU D00038 TaxID=2812554 RepID=UPI001966F9FB|nr:ABC transporter permease [Nocardioides sp. SYSU D00038]
MSSAELVWFVAGLLVLTAATTGIARWAGVGLGAAPFVALGRAAVQLTVVALLLRGILTVPATVVAFLVLMASTASWTAAGRLGRLWHGRRIAVAGVLCGATVALAAVFALRLVDPDVRYLVAVSGIVIGAAMTAATLAGRSFLRGAGQRRDEVEAWLSLGATPGRAHLEIGQEAVREALLPTLDQTRSTGLVTLPGAFVGALFGGASPAEAAQFQLVVLAGIALCMTITGVVVTRLLGRSPFVVATAGD